MCPHIISNKISKVIGIMKRTKRFVNKETLRTIYNSLIQPHLYYSILAWGSCNVRIFKLQKKAMRTVCGVKYNAHTDKLFKELNILKVKDIFIIQCAKFYHKFVNGKLPLYFHNFFDRNSDIHSYNTRSNNRLHLYPYNNQTTKNFIRFKIPNIINDLPRNVREKIYTHSLAGFAQYMKKHLINEYEIECNTENCCVCENQ